VGEAIHVHFCSRDSVLAMAIGDALGPGFEIRHSRDFEAAASLAEEKWVDVVLLDLRSSESETFERWIQHAGHFNRGEFQPPMIVMVDGDDRALTLRIMEGGAYDSISHPPDIIELRLALRRAYKFRQANKALQETRAQDRSASRLHELIGASDCMQEVFALTRKIAPCDVSVLITGETGTGKELLARAIHRLSPRANHPFVAFSCSNLPETLVEDELFGHEKGAFTGALASRHGRLGAADQGTVFLDEIGDLGLGLQPKLLRVLQEKTFERLGSNTPITVDLRTIFATNRNLSEMVQQGKFREDLYYRINVIQIHLPPLHERRDDISFLAKHFLARTSDQFGKKAKRFSHAALRALEEFDWPGNVRQLENVIQRAVVLADGQTIEAWHFPMPRREAEPDPQCDFSYEEEVRSFKRRLILRTLRECGWKKTESARSLKVARGYLHRLINDLQIRREEEIPNAELLLGENLPPKRIM